MSEAQSLFALVVFVYALECLVVIRRGELVAVSLAGPRHRVVTHERALKILRYGVALAPPLPFLGGVYRLGPGDGSRRATLLLEPRSP